MIFDITYRNRKTQLDIESLTGKSFPFLERIKMKGIGTSKLILKTATHNIEKLFLECNDTRYVTIECRPKGIVVGFSTRMKIYVLAIPYYSLSIYYNNGLLTIFSKEYKIKLAPSFNKKIDKTFLSKILMLKAKYLNQNI